MPIRPENRDRYPKNWKSEIVPRIRERSGDRCECIGECGVQHGIDRELSDPDLFRCGVTNRDIGYFDALRVWHIMPPHEKGETVTDRGKDCKVFEIVLTVGHINHTPEDCRDENLRHWCQSCHNRFDAPMRRAGMKARAHAQRAVGDLFTCTEVPPCAS